MNFRPTISLQLEILPSNKIIIPGCEPTSGLSSRVLSAYLAKNGCGNALVDLNIALMAIPGSTVKFGINYNRGVYKQRWFVLPGVEQGCPLKCPIDYYKILKSLASSDLPLTESFDKCDINGMGYCPSPDFNLSEPPPVNPYQREGSFPAAGGILPPLPSWQGGDYGGSSE